jgi:hypothetical protein
MILRPKCFFSSQTVNGWVPPAAAAFVPMMFLALKFLGLPSIVDRRPRIVVTAYFSAMDATTSHDVLLFYQRLRHV